MKKILFYISGILTLAWGISHLIPTPNVVKDFGDISLDNKLIITMEWIVEGMTLMFLGILTIVLANEIVDSRLKRNMSLSVIGMLFAMAILSIFTGFRIDFLPFKLCPIIFSVSAILIIIGMRLKIKSL